MRYLIRLLGVCVLVAITFFACMDFGDGETEGCEPYTFDLNGNSCRDVVCPDDGNPCTRNYCKSGRCRTEAYANGTTCTYDGLDGVCVNGVCGENLCADVVCDDDDSCTEDTCDYIDGLCDYTPKLPNGAACVYDGMDGVCVNGICGENLCADVVCDDDDSCTEDTCDYVDGSCVHTALGDGAPCTLDGLSGHCASGVCLVDCGRAPDGTPCGDGAGTCQAGSCEGRFACTEQGIRDAIWVGEGPHTFDCGGPQRVVIGATVVIDKDVILDGESELIIDGGEESRGVVAVEAGVTAELRSVTVTGGHYGEWGGILNQGTLTVTDSTVSANTATYGGGVRNEGTLTLARSTVSGNEALHGAGIYNFGTLVATNVTLSGNRTPTPNNFDSGAAVRNQGVMTMTSSTVSGNEALHGGDVAQYAHVPAVITNTLIDGSCYLHTGTITSAGYNIESAGDTCGFDPDGTDLVNVPDPMLGPLQDNGGPTETHALLPGSPAINRIPEAACEVETDQRGEPRPAGDGCDVGAFEVQP